MLELAKPGLGEDATEDRAELVELVKKLVGNQGRNLPVPAEVVPKLVSEIGDVATGRVK